MKCFHLAAGVLLVVVSALVFGPIAPAQANTNIDIQGTGSIGDFWGRIGRPLVKPSKRPRTARWTASPSPHSTLGPTTPSGDM